MPRFRSLSPLALLLAAVPVLAAPPVKAKATERADSPLADFPSRNLGPAVTSGRVGDIAVDPRKPDTWYVGVASGGVWKTVNGGTTWTPLFDKEGSFSIGCVTVDPRDSNTVWVGTGENNSQRSRGLRRRRVPQPGWREALGEHGPEGQRAHRQDPRGPAQQPGGLRGRPGTPLEGGRRAWPLQDHRWREDLEGRAHGGCPHRRHGRGAGPPQPRCAVRRHLPAAPPRVGHAGRRPRRRHPQEPGRRPDLGEAHRRTAQGGHGPHRPGHPGG